MGQQMVTSQKSGFKVYCIIGLRRKNCGIPVVCGLAWLGAAKAPRASHPKNTSQKEDMTIQKPHLNSDGVSPPARVRQTTKLLSL